jgi:hypothetical protein
MLKYINDARSHEGKKKRRSQIEEDTMSVTYGKEKKSLYGFLGIIEGNGPPNGITNPRKQNDNTNRKEIL